MDRILYGRTIEVLLGEEGQEGTLIVASFDDRNSLRVDFRASYSLDGTPGRTSVEIYNPPQKVIHDMLLGEHAFISVKAGYGGVTGLVFAGSPLRDDVRAAHQNTVERHNGDIVLTINAVNGGSRYREATASVGRTDSVKASKAANALCIAGGWTLGRTDFEDNLTYPFGYFFTGRVADGLREIAAYTGTDLAYDGDTVNFIHPTRAGTMLQIPVFSSKNGNLIGDPQRVARGDVEFRGLLVPDMRVGNDVMLEYTDLATGSKVKQRVSLREVTYVGSNYTNTFYVEATGRPIKEA